MKKQQQQQITRFKYKFTPTMLALAYAVIVLSLVGIAVSVWRITKFGIGGFSDALKSPFLILICVLCIVIVVAMLVKSQYTVDEQYYTTQFGLIKSKFQIKDITSLVLNTDLHKLTVYFGEQYAVLSIDPVWNDAFISALREVNPNIDFSFTLAEKKDETDKPEKKK